VRLAHIGSNRRDPSSKNLKSSCFSRHKPALWKNVGASGKHSERPIILSPDCFSCYPFLSVNYSFSTNFFSTPPGVCRNKKTPSYFRPPLMARDPQTHPKYVNAQGFLQCEDALSVIPAILLVWVVWVSSRRSSRTGPLTLHSCKWPSRFVDQPYAAFPAPSDTASSPSRH